MRHQVTPARAVLAAAATIGVTFSLGPTAAQAEVITPQVVKPSLVTPHEVSPAPAPAPAPPPAPSPSAPAPSGSAPASPGSGAQSGGSPRGTSSGGAPAPSADGGLPREGHRLRLMDSRPSTGSLGGPLNPDDMDDVLFTTAWVAEGGWTFGWQRDLPIPSDGTKPEPMTSDIILAIEIAGRELSISLLGPHKAVTDTSAAAPQPSPQDLADSATDSTPDAGAEGGGGLGGSGPKVFEDEETSEE